MYVVAFAFRVRWGCRRFADTNNRQYCQERTAESWEFYQMNYSAEWQSKAADTDLDTKNIFPPRHSLFLLGIHMLVLCCSCWFRIIFCASQQISVRYKNLKWKWKYNRTESTVRHKHRVFSSSPLLRLRWYELSVCVSVRVQVCVNYRWQTRICVILKNSLRLWVTRKRRIKIKTEKKKFREKSHRIHIHTHRCALCNASSLVWIK